MARGRGGRVGRGARGRRGGRLHNIVTTSDNIVSDSTANVDDNVTSLENVSVTNSGSQSNNENLQHPPLVDEARENPPLGDERIKLHVVNKKLDNSSTCSRAITKIFKEKIDAEGYTWTKVSQEAKDFYFGEFKKIFEWERVSETVIKEAWSSKAAERYNDLMREVRDKMVKPGFIADESWTKFTAYWKSPEYEKKREINKANRKQGEGSSTHTGGSISFAEHAKKLEAAAGRPPTEIELFLYTHTKEHPIPTKGNPIPKEHENLTFINPRSKEINDNMVRLRKGHQANHESGEVEAQVIESTLFYEAVGGKRKRVYGNGSNVFNMLNPNRNLNPTSSKQDGPPSGNKDLKMERKLSKLTKENGSLKHTLELLCKHVGIPTPEFDPDSDSEDNDEESAPDAHQPHTSNSEAGASHDH